MFNKELKQMAGELEVVKAIRQGYIEKYSEFAESHYKYMQHRKERARRQMWSDIGNMLKAGIPAGIVIYLIFSIGTNTFIEEFSNMPAGVFLLGIFGIGVYVFYKISKMASGL